jgi:hypothetical protein
MFAKEETPVMVASPMAKLPLKAVNDCSSISALNPAIPLLLPDPYK